MVRPRPSRVEGAAHRLSRRPCGPPVTLEPSAGPLRSVCWTKAGRCPNPHQQDGTAPAREQDTLPAVISWLIRKVARWNRQDGRAIERLVNHGVPRDRAEDARDRKYLMIWYAWRPGIVLFLLGGAIGGRLAPIVGMPVLEPLTAIGLVIAVTGLVLPFRSTVGSYFARELLIRELFSLVDRIDAMNRVLSDLSHPSGFSFVLRRSTWDTRNQRVRIVAGASGETTGRVWLIAALCARVAARPRRDRRRAPWNELARVALWFADQPHDQKRAQKTLDTCAQVINHLYVGDLLTPPPIAVSADQLPDLPPLLRARLAPHFATVINGVLVSVVGGLLLAWLVRAGPPK